MSLKTQLEDVCDWIVNLEYENIPDNIIILAKAQILNSFAAICAGSRSAIGNKCKKVLIDKSGDGPCTIFPFGEKRDIEQAVYYHSSMINSLEFDDFVFMGHIAQSAVSVPLSLGEKLDLSGRDFLIAMVAAEEVAGRLSAFMVNGPLQGHMRSFIHRVAGAIASSKLLRLDQEQTMRAIAIALSCPEHLLYHAAFSPETKVLCTGPPAVEGMRSALMASEGVDGAVDIIEHAAGFFSTFSYSKRIPDIWRSMGKTWTLSTLSVKEYTTCAYAQGPVKAAVDLFNSKQILPDDIANVTIYAPITTVVMEKFSQPHDNNKITPVNTQFSTKRSVAAALLFGPLYGKFYTDGVFDKKIDAIKDLSQKIEIKHDWKLTIDALKGVDQGIINAGRPGFLSFGNGSTALKKFEKVFGSRKLFELRDIPEILSLPKNDLRYLVRRYFMSFSAKFISGKTSYNRAKYFSTDGDLSKMDFRMSGRIELRMNNGNVMHSYCRRPDGFSTSPKRMEVIESKYSRETIEIWGEEVSEAIKNKIDNLEKHSIRELTEILCRSEII